MKVKKVLAFLVAIALLVSCAAMAAADVVEIKNEAELIAFRERVEAGETTLDAKLTADITLTGPWTPIGKHILDGSSLSDDYSYSGTFDGDGHTVSGLALTAANAVDVEIYDDPYKTLGFFGIVGEAGVVKNVRLAAPSVDALTDYHDYWYFAGGVAGVLLGRIEDCSVTDGTVTGGDAGGIVGSVEEGASVSGCSVSNTVVTADDGDGGGIAGECGGTISNCTVPGGTVTGYNAGGVAGSVWEGASVSGCSVSNIVVSADDDCGGIAGECGGAISNCTVSGALTEIGSPYAGGITGYLWWNGASVTNCTVTGIGGIEGSYVGGVVGLGGGTVSSCIASDLTVKSTREAGALIGEHWLDGENSLLENSAAIGVTVTGTGDGSLFIGGLVGWSDAPIRNCVVYDAPALSVSAVNSSGTAYAGGVLGSLGSSSVAIENCLFPAGIVKTGDIYSGNEEWAIGNISEDRFVEFNITNVKSYDASAAASTLQAVMAVFKNYEVAVEVEKGKTYTLDVTTLPGTAGDYSFAWSTASADIATVSPATGAQATLSGVELGTTTVTCTVTGDIEATLTCAVTVVEPTSGGGGSSSNCSTFGFGLVLLAAVPFLYRRKR